LYLVKIDLKLRLRSRVDVEEDEQATFMGLQYEWDEYCRDSLRSLQASIEATINPFDQIFCKISGIDLRALVQLCGGCEGNRRLKRGKKQGEVVIKPPVQISILQINAHSGYPLYSSTKC